MDKLRLEAVAARVVAWHNRHSLARRISVAQVVSIGYVALPFWAAGPDVAADAAPQAPTGVLARLRARLAPALSVPALPAPTLRAAFSEDFIAPLSPRRVAGFAARHGVAMAERPDDAPLRELHIDLTLVGLRSGRPVTRYLATAAVEDGGQRLRVLIGAGEAPAVMGTRRWSPARAAASLGLGLVMALALGAAAGWLSSPSKPQEAAQTQSVQPATAAALPVAASETVHPVPAVTALPAQPAASAASAASASDLGRPAPATPAPSALAQALTPLAAALPSSALALAPIAAAPAASQTQLVAPDRPKLLLLPIDDAAKALARETLVALRAQPRSAAPAAAAPSASLSKDKPAAASAPMPPPATVYALSTKKLRTRAESEQVAMALRALLITPQGGKLELGAFEEGADWRVVAWPFARREDAERARSMLESRGLRVHLVDF